MTARRVSWYLLLAGVVLLAVACAFYFLLIMQRAVVLLDSGRWLAIALGCGLIILVLIGIWVVWRELGFGRQTARLAKDLESENGLPVDDLPRRPSGHPVRAAADARFAERKSEVDQDPDDWRRWFRLGLAYDDAGDRRRARAALRQAIVLHGAVPGSKE